MEFLTSLFSSVTALAPRAAWAVFIVSGFLKLAPLNWQEKLSVEEISEKQAELLGFAFLISAAIVTIQISVELKERIKKIISARQYRTAVIHHLENLSGEEKECLRRFINDDTSTIQLPMNAGVAGSLEAKMLIFRSSSLSSFGAKFPYSIQPVAREIIVKKPHLLN